MAAVNTYLNFNGNTEEAFNFYKSGEVQCMKNGGLFDAVFFDFYRLVDGKIKEISNML